MNAKDHNESLQGPGHLVEGAPHDEDVRLLGEIIRDARNLDAAEVERVLAYQREHAVKFGEAAIALGLATPEDVLRALAQQFNYAYGGSDRQRTSPELVSLNQPFSSQAEAIRAIRAQIMLRMSPERRDMPLRGKQAIAVVSPNSGDGKTFFCANLAVSLAQLGGRTLVVDADLRGARLHEVFDVENKTGLSGLLSGRRGDGVVKAVVGVPKLFVLPVGITPPNPLELLESPQFGLLLHELLQRFDHVIVDTPAAQYGADCAVVAARCGAALVVARQDVGRSDDLQSLVQMLTAVNSQVAGVVLNQH